jgi:hypothetical protein
MVSRAVFIREFAEALDAGTAAFFVGAGLSKPAGFADWRMLLRGIAEELELDVDRETDLISLAQFHLNERRNRAALNDLLINEFTKDVRITRNHELIAHLPVHTVWTGNYDTLIEDAFRLAHKRPDVKITQENLATTAVHRDVIIYKMHGDISQPHDAVLTRDDYEAYEAKRALFSIQLKGDLVSKTFAFLGFSFTDPNIDYILSRIRVLMGENQRTHYCIMRHPPPPRGKGKKRAQQEYDAKRMSLRIADLQRYNIQAVLIDEYEEITEILEGLSLRTNARNVFVSGSATAFEPYGREQIEALAHGLGHAIIKDGYNLISGFGLGIGGGVILGSMEALYAELNSSPSDRTILRPFPQMLPTGMTKEAFHTRYREELISNARFAIFIAGNRMDHSTDKTIIAPGVLEEFRIAKEMKKYIVPIGATGHAAREIWKRVRKAPAIYYGQVDVSAELEVIGDVSKSPEKLVGAAMEMVKKLADGRSAAAPRHIRRKPGTSRKE